MSFPAVRFLVKSSQLNAQVLRRSIAERLKADIYGQRVFEGITYQNPKGEADALAQRNIAQLHVTQEGTEVVITVGMRDGLMEDRFELAQIHARSNPDLYKRLESMVRAIKALKAEDWPGFSRPMHGQSLRQLWCYALDALEGKSGKLHEVFQRNTQASVSDLVTEASVRGMLLVQEHEARFGCMPSQIQEQFAADVTVLRDLAIGVALTLGHGVYQEGGDGALAPVAASDYLSTLFFKAPRHFKTAGRHPYDFFDIGLRNPLSFSIVDAVELREAHAIASGYQKAQDGIFTVLAHPSQGTIYVVALPRAMVQRLQHFQVTTLELKAKQQQKMQETREIPLSIKDNGEPSLDALVA